MGLLAVGTEVVEVVGMIAQENSSRDNSGMWISMTLTDTKINNKTLKDRSCLMMTYSEVFALYKYGLRIHHI